MYEAMGFKVADERAEEAAKEEILIPTMSADLQRDMDEAAIPVDDREPTEPVYYWDREILVCQLAHIILVCMTLGWQLDTMLYLMNLCLALRNLTQTGSRDSTSQQDAHGLLGVGLNMIRVSGYFFTNCYLFAPCFDVMFALLIA
jgi:hypothetical protein